MPEDRRGQPPNSIRVVTSRERTFPAFDWRVWPIKWRSRSKQIDGADSYAVDFDATAGADNLTVIGFDGKEQWSQTRDEPARVVNGPAADNSFRGLQAPLRWKQLYRDLKVTRREAVGTREAYLLEATTKEGSPVRMYFDVTTFLLLARAQQQNVVTMDSAGNVQRRSVEVFQYFDDYRGVEGLMLPFLLNTSSQFGVSSARYVEIRRNVPIDDRLFEMP